MYAIGEKLDFFKSVFGSITVSRDGKNVAVRCPICDPIDKSKQKLVIRTIDDIAHCWVCGWKSRSIVPLLRKYFPSHLKEYIDKFSKKDEYVDVSNDQQICLEDLPVTLPTNFRLLATSTKDDLEARIARNYVISRGLTEEDMWYYKLGVSSESELTRRVVVISFDSIGKLNYYSARSLNGSKPKYVNSKTQRLNIIFNEIYIDWNKPLVLCEGPFDMFKCGQNVTCLLGSELNEEYKLFDQIVIHNTPVILSLDADMKSKSRRFAKKLSEYDIDVSMIDIGSFHDPGQMSKQEFSNCLTNVKKCSWNNMFNDRLTRASKISMEI